MAFPPESRLTTLTDLQQWRPCMRQKKSLGIDLKVYTREEIEFMVEEDNPFIAQVFKEGKVLWSLDDNQKACCPS